MSSILPIAAGAIIPMILGFIWYHPKVFGTVWANGAGLSEEDLKSGNPMIMVGALILAGVVSYSMSRYASHTEPGMSQFVHGMFHGLLPAMVAVPVLASNALFEQKSILKEGFL